MKKHDWDQVFEPLLDAGRKVGANLAEQMRKQKDKVDDFVRQARSTDSDGVSLSDVSGPGGGRGPDMATNIPRSEPFPDPPPDLVWTRPLDADRDLVDRFDPTTSRDGATFWSGTGDNGAAAGRYAEAHGGSSLEQMLEAQGMMPEMQAMDWMEEGQPTWQAISERLAAAASGDVVAIHGDNVNPGSVWNSVEFPTLVRNENVTSITVLNMSGEVVRSYVR